MPRIRIGLFSESESTQSDSAACFFLYLGENAEL